MSLLAEQDYCQGVLEEFQSLIMRVHRQFDLGQTVTLGIIEIRTCFVNRLGDTARLPLVHMENSLVHTAGWLKVCVRKAIRNMRMKGGSRRHKYCNDIYQRRSEELLYPSR